jgi:hypothetical protein
MQIFVHSEHILTEHLMCCLRNYAIDLFRIERNSIPARVYCSERINKLRRSALIRFESRVTHHVHQCRCYTLSKCGFVIIALMSSSCSSLLSLARLFPFSALLFGYCTYKHIIGGHSICRDASTIY